MSTAQSQPLFLYEIADELNESLSCLVIFEMKCLRPSIIISYKLYQLLFRYFQFFFLDPNLTFLFLMSQTIQIEGTTRKEKQRHEMEIAGEEGRFSKSHFFFILAKEEKRRRTKNELQFSSWY